MIVLNMVIFNIHVSLPDGIIYLYRPVSLVAGFVQIFVVNFLRPSI